jgi:hypothetical protein
MTICIPLKTLPLAAVRERKSKQEQTSIRAEDSVLAYHWTETPNVQMPPTQPRYYCMHTDPVSTAYIMQGHEDPNCARCYLTDQAASFMMSWVLTRRFKALSITTRVVHSGLC